MIRALFFIPALLFTSHLCGATCAPTPEAAAQSVIGQPSKDPGRDTGTGYRVQDVQVDAIMHRVWVRVIHCEDPSEPAVLVPLRATLASGAPVAAPAVSEAVQPYHTSVPIPVQVAAIHAGDTVRVFFATESVQMEMEGTADTQAAVGDTMNVTLKRRGDEPSHRIHGVLRADHRVEVQP